MLILAVAAVAALVYARRHIAGTRDAEELRRYAAVFEPGDIKEIDVVRGDETLSFRRENNEWRLTAPVVDRASPEAVDRLILAVRFLEVRDRQPAGDPTSVPDTGLAAPRARIDMRGECDLRLDLGAQAALPGEIFARIGGEKSVLRVADTIAALAGAPVESFRDPCLTNLVADDIEKFTVRRADGEMTVRRERGRWIIDKPVRATADAQAVREFLDPLLGLRITGFAPRADAGTAATLPGGSAAISMTPRGGGEDLDIEVRRQRAADGTETATVNLPARGGPLDVDIEALRLFEVSPEALRDRSLGHVDTDTVDRIILESDGRTMTLARDGDAWVAREDGRRVSGEEVEELAAVFNAARVTAFRTTASADDTGLAHPAQRVAFHAWLSENTPEEPAGGHIIAGADLGVSAPDGNVYARAAGSDETVTVPPDLVTALRRLVYPGGR